METFKKVHNCLTFFLLKNKHLSKPLTKQNFQQDTVSNCITPCKIVSSIKELTRNKFVLPKVTQTPFIIL